MNNQNTQVQAKEIGQRIFVTSREEYLAVLNAYGVREPREEVNSAENVEQFLMQLLAKAEGRGQ